MWFLWFGFGCFGAGVAGWGSVGRVCRAALCGVGGISVGESVSLGSGGGGGGSVGSVPGLVAGRRGGGAVWCGSVGRGGGCVGGVGSVGGSGAGGWFSAAGVLVRAGRGDMPCVCGAGGGLVPGRSGVAGRRFSGWRVVVRFCLRFRLGGVLCLLLLLVRSSVCRRCVRFRCSLACVVVGSRGGGRRRAAHSCGCACVRAGCGVPVRSQSGPILRVGSVVSGSRGLPFGPNVLRPHREAGRGSGAGGRRFGVRRAALFFPPSVILMRRDCQPLRRDPACGQQKFDPRRGDLGRTSLRVPAETLVPLRSDRPTKDQHPLPSASA